MTTLKVTLQDLAKMIDPLSSQSHLVITSWTNEVPFHHCIEYRSLLYEEDSMNPEQDTEGGERLFFFY
jgi:hypothetical protein